MSEAIQRLRQLADQHDPERKGLGAELHRVADQVEADFGGGEGGPDRDLLGFRNHAGHGCYVPIAGIRWIGTTDDGERGVLYLDDEEVETGHSAHDLAVRFLSLTSGRCIPPDAEAELQSASAPASTPTAAPESDSESAPANPQPPTPNPDSDSGRTMTDDLPGVMGGPGTYAGQPEPEEPTGGATGSEAGGELPGGFPGR